ncbi:hypothetical protein TWF694_011568 [Orbilia ellipsospora]|uniref:DNA repair protein Rad26 n=1 Tax=Orbilia ellipsospora TaxID=2528407 RepID=A0AAV9X5K7_9PEZI
MAAEEDDYFGDDDLLDNLDELQELENAAILASLTQKQQQQQQKQPPKNPYQISSKAAAYASTNHAQTTAQNRAGPSRPYTNPGYQPPRPALQPAQIKTATLSKEDQEVRAAFLERNKVRLRMRQEQQEARLAAQNSQNPDPNQASQQHQNASQQQAYLASQKQAQLSQTAANYSHRQRQLQPRGSYRQPTPSYITQPTLPSSPRHQSVATSNAQGSGVKRSGFGTKNGNTAANGAATGQYQTARSKPPVPTVGIARPEEYATYDESKELWDTAAPTEMVLQESNHTAILDPSVLGTSAFGTSAWISSNDPTLKTVPSHATVPDDMVDYGAVEISEVEPISVMEVDEAPKVPAAQLEELERLRKAAQQLLAEKEELQGKLKQATVDMQTKTGENLILRKKMEKAETEHKSEVDALRSFAQQKHEQSEKEIAALKNDLVKMQSTHDFDKNDHYEMSRELKQYQEKDKQVVKPNNAPITPRKSRLAAFRDGFDDEEAGMSMRSSPPIGLPGSRGRGTPTKSAKRKRKPNESPMKNSQTLMLPMLQSGNNSQRAIMLENGPESEEEEYAAMIDKMTLEDLGLGNDERQEFLESILLFRPDNGDLTILETLEHHHFPSEEVSLAALFMENVPQAEQEAAYGEFPARICCILIALWDRCYTEEFFEPLSLLLDFLYHVITNDYGATLIPIIMESFAEVVQRTVLLNSEAVFKGHYDKINPLVDIEKCLLLFESVAIRIRADEELAQHFWALIVPNFVAPLMTWNQPLSQLRLILNALPSSVFRTSYGPISPDPIDQSDYERVTVMHASFLLTGEPKPETPVSKISSPGHRRAEILAIRAQVLQFYSCIAATDHGIHRMVTNKNWQALSRVIVRMHHELEEIYEDRYNLPNSVSFVNNGVAFIHRVLKLQKSNDDIERLLSSTATNGNGYKHLVVFARVAFIKEGGFLGKVGIREAVREMAMEVLEGSVTMEQGDEIWGVFRGRSGGSVSGYGGEASMTESMIEADRILREEEMKG